MRTIKFKGKRLDNGEWVEGYYRGNNEGNEVWEGDILEGSNTGEICFDQGAFLIHSIYDNVLYSLFNYTTWDGKITCKVVGNKFDKISV